MRHLRLIMTAAALTALPLASSFAGNGSDTPPQTQGAAFPGATTSSGSSSNVTSKTTNGMAGGGMATENGTKAGGMSEKNSVMSTGATQVN